MRTYCTLKDIIQVLSDADQNYVPPVGFHNAHSYRGYYDQLAFEPTTGVSVRDMRNTATSACGETFTGWKGGEYTMGDDTECWISEEGCSGGQAIGFVVLAFLVGNPAILGEADR